ncbi:MAG: class I tRNA ligase family protein, partial [Actinomycetota bacterium]
IDLHGGGSDLIFPHHECERAQSEAATGVPFVRHWMHVAMVHMDGHKMSKSRGNLVFVDALRENHDPRAIRLGLIEHHYRHEWEWSTDLMSRNERRLSAWGESLTGREEDKVIDDARTALDDDLNTPLAVEVLDGAASRGLSVRSAAALLG